MPITCLAEVHLQPDMSTCVHPSQILTCRKTYSVYICLMVNMGCKPGQDPAGMVPWSWPLCVDWIFMLLGICPHSPNDFAMGSTTTLAAEEIVCGDDCNDRNFPPAVAGMLPVRQLSFSSKAMMPNDICDPTLNHGRGIDPVRYMREWFISI